MQNAGMAALELNWRYLAAEVPVRDLRASGLMKVRAGLTTLEEVIAVTNE